MEFGPLFFGTSCENDGQPQDSLCAVKHNIPQQFLLFTKKKNSSDICSQFWAWWVLDLLVCVLVFFFAEHWLLCPKKM